MATINPHIPRLGWSAPTRELQPNLDLAVAPALPGDQLNVDFSQRVVVEENVSPSATNSPSLPVCPTGPAPKVLGGLEMAAADSGFTLSGTGGLAQLESVTGSAGDALIVARSPANPNLSNWLNARARPVFSAQSLDEVVSEILPLVELVSQAPDPNRWSKATWNAFQLAASLSPEALTTAATAMDTPGALPGQIPPGLQLSLADPQVNRDTLVRMLRLRAFAAQIVEAELPSLMPAERKNYLQLVHDHGYANQQLARSQDPHSVLCSLNSPELLDKTRLALLPPQVAARFGDATRSQASRSEGLEAAFPKLNLREFFGSGQTDKESTEKALAFLAGSGKDIESPSPDLGGRTMREFIAWSPSESRSQWLERLAGKQVVNSLSRSWETLQADLDRLDSMGAPAESLRVALEKKQTPALAPALLVLNAPSLFEPAANGPSPQMSASLDAMMQVFWRATSPHIPFSDPLVSCGQSQLVQTHQEQLAKDRDLWTGVVGLKKTPVLAGLSDDSYSQRTATLPQRLGLDEPADDVALAVARLKRDLGPERPAFQRIMAGLGDEDKEADTVSHLHALRFDPKSFAVDVRPGQETFHFGGEQFSFQPQEGQWVPELVSATSVAYRVQVGQGGEKKTSLLRLPKGAIPSIDSQDNLKLTVFDPERFNEVSSRLKDFQVMDTRVQMTDRKLVEFAGGYAVLEQREAQQDAGQSLKSGTQLHKKDVDALVDQWLSGLAESDPATRPYGVLYELGPDNYVMGKDGIEGSYVDVAVAFRNERERSNFGFVTGGYGSAANWIVADNQPLSREQVQDLWKGTRLQPAEEVRRELFVQALQERLDPQHAVWASLPSAKRESIFASFKTDLQAILGPDVGNPSG